MKPIPRATGSFTHRADGGWTLAEMLISVGVGALILATLLSFYVFARRTLDATGNYEELDRQSRVALDKMSRDIRQAGALTNYDSRNLWFTNNDATGSLLHYVWDTNALTVSYTNGSTNSPGGGILLSNCTYWSAVPFQRNPSNGTTMTFWPVPSTNAAASAKVIVLNWVCLKTNYLSLQDSESVQTAKIVLRN